MKYIGSGLVERVFYSDALKTVEVKLIRNGVADSIRIPPVDQQLYKQPLIGEVVPVYSAPTSIYNRFLKSERYYYGSPISISGEDSVNLLESFNSEANLFSPIRLPSLQRYDGDVVLEGRVQGHLRISQTPPSFSDKYNTQQIWNSGETSTGDPILIITNGTPQEILRNEFDTHRTENINFDYSSLYLTSGQDLGLIQPYTGKLDILKGLSDSNKPLVDRLVLGSEAYLVSDRVILASKQRDILLSANRTVNVLSNESISMLSQQSILLEAPKIFLGEAAMLEHGEKFYADRSESFARAVKGDALLEVLEKTLNLIDTIISRDDTLASEKTQVGKIRSKLNTLLSNKVYLE